MTHPYRTIIAAPSVKKKKFCFFHNWEINLKLESYDLIIRDTKKINNRQVYYVNIFEAYNLKCSSCETEKPMGTNLYYWKLAMDDFFEKFKGAKK